MKYKSLVRVICIILGVAIALSIALDLAYSQERAPRSFVGFEAYEYPVISKDRIKGLNVVRAGRFEKTGLPFVTLENYVSPDGETYTLLTLVYSDATYPKLLAISVSLPDVGDMNHSLLALDRLATKYGGTRTTDLRSGLPLVEKVYSNGGFRAGLAEIDRDQYVVILVMCWNEPE